MATNFDATGKDMFEFEPSDLLILLGQPRPPEIVRMVDADLSATVTTASDKVIYVDDPVPWLVLAELHTYWDKDLPFDLLKRYALLKNRHRRPIACVVVLLRREANSSFMTETFRQENPLGGAWDFPFRVLRVWEISVNVFLSGPLSLIPFAPLAQMDTTDAPRVKARIEERIAKEASRSNAERLRTSLVQLLALRYDEEGIAFWSDMMATLDISKTPLANMYRREGRDEGRTEGRTEGRRETLLEQGAEKFGEPPVEIANAIAAIADDLRLRRLLKRVIQATSWQDLLNE